jgi:hypothetical protein
MGPYLPLSACEEPRAKVSRIRTKETRTQSLRITNVASFSSLEFQVLYEEPVYLNPSEVKLIIIRAAAFALILLDIKRISVVSLWVIEQADVRRQR